MRIFIYKIIYLIVLVILVFSCNKDDEQDNLNVVVLYTEPVKKIASGGVEFSAKLVKERDLKIINHGFIWSVKRDLNLNISYIVSLGDKIETDEFSAQVSSALKANVEYYVRSFIQDERNIFYGRMVSFTSNGSLVPLIECFDPDTAAWGDTITIKGKNFSYKKDENKVKFDIHESKVVGNSGDSIIKCIVPYYLNNYFSKISVSVLGLDAFASDRFILTPPVIYEMIPDSAVYDAPLEITGNYFKTNSTILSIGGVKAQITNISKNQIKTKVPNILIRGWNDVHIQVAGNTVVYSKRFKYLTPEILDINPKTVRFDEEVTIIGRYFNPTNYNNSLLLNNILTKITYYSSDTLKFIVPNILTDENGELSIKVKVGSYTEAYKDMLIITPPIINDFFPKEVIVGDTITIYGKNFNPLFSNSQVNVGDIKATIIYASYDSLKVIVPLGTKTGGNQINLTVNSQECQSAGTLSLLAPKINGITPTEGRRGVKIKIFGKNFSLKKDYNKVYFNEEPVLVLNSSRDTLTVEVRDVIIDGENDVSVVIGNQNSLLENCFEMKESWKIKTPISSSYSKWYYSPAGGIGVNYKGNGFVGLGSYFIVNGGIYSNSNKKFSKYDPNNNVWESLQTFPRSSMNANELLSHVYNDSLYVVYMGNALNEVWRYSFDNNNWKMISTYNASTYLFGFGYDNNIFLISSNGNMISFDINLNIWAVKNNFPDKPGHKKGVRTNEDIYLLGTENRLWKYNYSLDSWGLSTIIPFSSLGSASSIVCINNEIYFFPKNKYVYKYNASLNIWGISSLKAPEPRNYGGIFEDNYYFNIGNTIYISMFYLSSYMYEHLYEYDPAKDDFTEVTP